MQVHDIGEPRQLTSHWFDADGEGIEPSAIVLTVTGPGGASSTYNKTDLTQGDTTADWFRWVTPNADGAWLYTFVGTVDGSDVEQSGTFLVGGMEATGPCEPWCSWSDVLACGSLNAAATTATAEQKETWLDEATEILFDLTDRHYPGICAFTRSLCYACASCAPRACSCDPHPAIDLGGRYPVWGVYDVTIEGVSLPSSAYALRGRRWLVRTDGQAWPSGWNTIDPDAWRATWATGRMVTSGGKAAAARLALEIAKRCSNDSSCKLPSRVTNVNREGVTFTILDSMTLIAEGRTGLDLVDLWVAADRKGRKPQPGAFHPALYGSRRI